MPIQGSFPGTILCGPSGVGKTTVLRCMFLGDEEVSSMRGEFDNTDVSCWIQRFVPK